jgi:riboflavin synthase
MFTGIIETTGKIIHIDSDGTNKTFTVQSPISKELKIDQSVAHNGVCLTVIDIDLINNCHRVTAIEETLNLSNLGNLNEDSLLNIERCLKLSDRLDGHMVQGHVDGTGECVSKNNMDGSWEYKFKYDPSFASLIVPKGSICVNGVSLTAINPILDEFSVAIIPFTFEHTNFKLLEPGDKVNLEFDILGKYLLRQDAIKKGIL